MPNVPDALLGVYAEIIRNSPNVESAVQHLSAFIADVTAIDQSIQAAITAAQQRAANVH